MSSLEFRLEKLDKTRSYLLEETNYDDLMGKKYKKTCKYLNCVERLLILVSTVIRCVSIFAFVSLVCVPVGVTSSGIKKYKSIIKKKKKKKHDKILL